MVKQTQVSLSKDRGAAAVSPKTPLAVKPNFEFLFIRGQQFLVSNLSWLNPLFISLNVSELFPIRLSVQLTGRSKDKTWSVFVHSPLS